MIVCHMPLVLVIRGAKSGARPSALVLVVASAVPSESTWPMFKFVPPIMMVPSGLVPSLVCH